MKHQRSQHLSVKSGVACTELDEIPDKFAVGKRRYTALSGCNGTGFLKLQLHDLNINGAFFRATVSCSASGSCFELFFFPIPTGLSFSLLVQVSVYVYTHNFAAEFWEQLRVSS